MVKEGDVLFTIDRRPFQIALAQTQASLAQARATLAFAESDLARAQGLTLGTVITQQTFDQRTQAKRIAEASVAAFISAYMVGDSEGSFELADRAVALNPNSHRAWGSRGLRLVYLELELLCDEASDALHHPLTRSFAADVNVTVVRVPNEAVSPSLQLLVEFVEHEVT